MCVFDGVGSAHIFATGLQRYYPTPTRLWRYPSKRGQTPYEIKRTEAKALLTRISSQSKLPALLQGSSAARNLLGRHKIYSRCPRSESERNMGSRNIYRAGIRTYKNPTRHDPKLEEEAVYERPSTRSLRRQTLSTDRKSAWITLHRPLASNWMVLNWDDELTKFESHVHVPKHKRRATRSGTTTSTRSWQHDLRPHPPEPPRNHSSIDSNINLPLEIHLLHPTPSPTLPTNAPTSTKIPNPLLLLTLRPRLNLRRRNAPRAAKLTIFAPTPHFYPLFSSLSSPTNPKPERKLPPNNTRRRINLRFLRSFGDVWEWELSGYGRRRRYDYG